MLSATSTGQQILVVDDSEPNRMLLREILVPLGLEVVEACRGDEAVSIVCLTPPALVFMDIAMPVMDGLTATRELRGLGYQMPVVIVTAFQEEDFAAPAREAGANAYLSKPLDMCTIETTLRHFGILA